MTKINSREKGKAGEREFSNLCKSHGYDTRRSQQYCGVAGDADVIGLPHMHIEVKRVERLNVSNAIGQAMNDKKPQEIAIVAHRKNREEWLITMRAEDWFEMYKAFEEKRKEEGWDDLI